MSSAMPSLVVLLVGVSLGACSARFGFDVPSGAAGEAGATQTDDGGAADGNAWGGGSGGESGDGSDGHCRHGCDEPR